MKYTTIRLEGVNREEVLQKAADLATLMGERIISQWSPRSPQFCGYSSEGYEMWQMVVYVEDKDES